MNIYEAIKISLKALSNRANILEIEEIAAISLVVNELQKHIPKEPPKEYDVGLTENTKELPPEDSPLIETRPIREDFIPYPNNI